MKNSYSGGFIGGASKEPMDLESISSGMPGENDNFDEDARYIDQNFEDQEGKVNKGSKTEIQEVSPFSMSNYQFHAGGPPNSELFPLYTIYEGGSSLSSGGLPGYNQPGNVCDTHTSSWVGGLASGPIDSSQLRMSASPKT